MLFTPVSPSLARPISIGPVALRTNLLLAPVANYCDLAWRLICREQGGVGLACTDLLSPQGLLRGTAHSLDLAKTTDADRPLCMQLYGSDGDILAEGALWAVRHGATTIDINMGCPVDKVCKKDGGSKMLCDPDRTVTIAAKVVREVDRATAGRVPVTAKMRLGWGADDMVAPDLAVALARSGIAAITVHGRTAAQKFTGEVSHDGIRRVVEAVAGAMGGPERGGPPVIGNGDVTSADRCVEMIARTGCAGVMIGRGSFARPWIFRQCWAAQRAASIGSPALRAGCGHGGPALRAGCESWVDRTRHGVPSHHESDHLPTHEGVDLVEPSEAQKVAIIRRYFELMLTHRDEHYALNHMRRRISWMGKALGPCKPLKEAVRTAADAAAVHAALDAFLAGGLRVFEGAENEAEISEASVG